VGASSLCGPGVERGRGRMAARRSSSKNSVSTPEPTVISSVEFNETACNFHNQLRFEHGVPPLEVSNRLAKWARLTAAESACLDRLEAGTVPKDEDGNGRCGQNLWAYEPLEQGLDEAFAERMAIQGIQNWYEELDLWNFDRCTPVESAKKGETRHFTQLVWRSTKRLGCAMARSSSGRWYFACNYFPVGNVRRQFRRNVPPLGGHPEGLTQAVKGEAATSIQAMVRGRSSRESLLKGDQSEGFHYLKKRQGMAAKARRPSTCCSPAGPATTATARRGLSKSSPQEATGGEEGRLVEKGRHAIESGMDLSEAQMDFERPFGLSDSAPAAAGFMTTADRVKKTFRCWDADGNGTISQQELSHVFVELGFTDEETEKLFKAIDRDGSGLIDFDEFVSFLFPVPDHVTP